MESPVFQDGHDAARLIVLVGAIAALAPLIRGLLLRLALPALVGFLILGASIRLAHDRFELLDVGSHSAFAFLGNLGLVVLLFRIGLSSHLSELVKKLPSASVVWFANVLLAGAAGFVTARFLLDLELAPSLVVATALTATSVAVSVAIWAERGRLESDDGRLLLDVAELDDISGLLLMAILFAVLPEIHAGNGADAGMIMQVCGVLLVKLALFVSGCYLFARYLEPQVRRFSQRFESRRTGLTLTVAGFAFMIAGFAEWLGFSLAVGALFAGLAFSRDPHAVRTDRSFVYLYDLLTPFFFIHIGLHFQPDTIAASLELGAALLAAAIIGKVLGAFPLLFTAGATTALTIGVSLVPRAEIAFVILDRARELGDWAMSEELFGAMLVVSAGTCLLAPVGLKGLLRTRGRG